MCQGVGGEGIDASTQNHVVNVHIPLFLRCNNVCWDETMFIMTTQCLLDHTPLSVWHCMTTTTQQYTLNTTTTTGIYTHTPEQLEIAKKAAEAAAARLGVGDNALLFALLFAILLCVTR